jgi:hypothetical protein
MAAAKRSFTFLCRKKLSFNNHYFVLYLTSLFGPVNGFNYFGVDSVSLEANPSCEAAVSLYWRHISVTK